MVSGWLLFGFLSLLFNCLTKLKLRICISRVQTVIRALKQTRSHVDHVRRDIDSRLKDVKLVHKKVASSKLLFCF